MRKFILLIGFWVASSSVMACDFCGCAGGIINPSILPQFHNNFVGLRWSKLTFQYPAHQTIDEVMSLDLQFRYYLTGRFQLVGNIPFHRLQRQGSNDNPSLTGWGDASLSGQFRLFEQIDTSGLGTHHQLWLGIGTKFASGAQNEEDLSELPAHFRLGTGTYDLQLFLNYQLQIGRLGFNLQSSYQKALSSNRGYFFGDQFQSAFLLFTRKQMGFMTLMPSIGVEGEWLSRDVEEGFYVAQTGGNGIFLMPALSWFTPRLALNLTYRQPISQNYAMGDIESRSRWSASISYLF